MSEAEPPKNRARRVGITVAGMVGLTALMVAGAGIWLMLTDPVTVAEAVDSGDYGPLVEDLVDVIYEAIVGLFSYL